MATKGGQVSGERKPLDDIRRFMRHAESLLNDNIPDMECGADELTLLRSQMYEWRDASNRAEDLMCDCEHCDCVRFLRKEAERLRAGLLHMYEYYDGTNDEYQMFAALWPWLQDGG